VDVTDAVSRLGHLIDGRIVRNDALLPITSPSSGEVVAQCPHATESLLDEAMAAAQRAQLQWYALGETARQKVIGQMSDALVAHLDEIVAISALEKGAIGAALEAYAAPPFMAHLATTAVPVDVLEDTPERTVTVVRKPVGVVAALIPTTGPDATPPVNGFWSITMYMIDGGWWFVPNALNKFTASPRDNPRPNADGSLTLYFQNESPGKDKEANWLPAPKGDFLPMMRMYWPKDTSPSIINGSWKPPAVVKVN